MKRIEHQWWLAPLAALLALQFLALALYWRDQRYLARLMDGIASPSLPPSDQAKQVVAFLSSNAPDSRLLRHPGAPAGSTDSRAARAGAARSEKPPGRLGAGRVPPGPIHLRL